MIHRCRTSLVPNRSNSPLAALDLTGCELDDGGLSALATALRHPRSTVRSVEIATRGYEDAGGWIDEGAPRLVEVL
jgi:hypothetical protein